jgi:SAM-dependent methyltransferase
MPADIHGELHAGLTLDGPERLPFVRRAFGLLSAPPAPVVLDAGCGRGGSSVELARLGAALVVGLDIDARVLGVLRRRAASAGLSDRVAVVLGTLAAPGFRDRSFDVVWAEGSVHVIGLRHALRDWRRLIGPHGFLVLHEMCWLAEDPPGAIRERWRRSVPEIATVSAYAGVAEALGYRVVGSFALPRDFWWEQYFLPLLERIGELRRRYARDAEALRALADEERDAELHGEHRDWYGSAFLVLQKAG